MDEFERRLEAGDLRGAVELYKGPFLVDLGFGEPEFDHWADRLDHFWLREPKEV